MVRFHQLLALILLLAVTASGQVVTSDSGALTTRVWGATVNAPWYLRTIVVQGATPLDLTDRYVSFTVRQVDTEALVYSSTGTIHVVNPGEVIFTWTPRAPGTFAAAAKVRRVDTDEIVANIMADTIVVTNPPTAGGGGSATVVISNQHMASLRSDGAPTGRVPVSRSDGGVDLLPWAAGGGDGNVVATNTGTEGQVLKSSGNGNTGYWGNAASGGGESNVYRHIASYTYTGGETSVTFAFDPYCRVDLDMAGQFSPTNTAGVVPFLGVQINGHPWIYRTDMKYDANSDAHPNTVLSFASSYPGSSNLFVLGNVGRRNDNVAYARGMTAARWSFMSSARGIHMEGRGHMSYGSDIGGDYTFDSFGSLQTNDYVNNNAITQLVVICMNITNGQYLVSSESNATFRLRGVRCD